MAESEEDPHDEGTPPADEAGERVYFHVKLRHKIPPEGLLVTDDQGRTSVARTKVAQQLLHVTRPSTDRVVSLMDQGMRPVKLPNTRTPKGGDKRGPSE